ncbi:MAG TPA: di-trans,poly-cis-decaprenylcistransferase, partial [Candidatus Handelsmanbacteria bacterium]|nr:di-trans,poly-cis-decaprenylcistransferase [Candidatus Handelsmanbacteria bacterium]
SEYGRYVKSLGEPRDGLGFEEAAVKIQDLFLDGQKAEAAMAVPDELVDACRALARQVRDGELDADSIDEAAIDGALYTAGLPDPDLLIRCSGEMRLSNFLPWQMVYTEIYFTPVFWPEFRRHHLYEAVRDFQQRQRRFGA